MKMQMQMRASSLLLVAGLLCGLVLPAVRVRADSNVVQVVEEGENTDMSEDFEVAEVELANEIEDESAETEDVEADTEEEEAEEEAEAEEEGSEEESFAEAEAEAEAEVEVETGAHSPDTKAHEMACTQAWNALSAAERGLVDLKKVISGAAWNVLPVGTEKDESAMIKEGSMDASTFARLSLTGNENDLVYNVHHGCLQYWRARPPLQRTQSKISAPSKRFLFTNQQVSDMIREQLKLWWQAAVHHVRSTTTTTATRDPAAGAWYVGHIVHTLQSLYLPSHVVRKGPCGKIIAYQGMYEYRYEYYYRR